jgi:hypothetical protein
VAPGAKWPRAGASALTCWGGVACRKYDIYRVLSQSTRSNMARAPRPRRRVSRGRTRSAVTNDKSARAGGRPTAARTCEFAPTVLSAPPPGPHRFQFASGQARDRAKRNL